ncbi:unnamed protein product [Rotaria socialis]|uniref:Uncharacterized protein n=3 Tax=Rotaria socialis TaxID=392032 RepID=A0A818PX93_9BILA|nr:unnamed protein product [Rotaria socialis]
MNLNTLPGEVLFYSNDQFYQFIENCLGVDQMNLLKVQSIKNIRTLIKIPDIFSALTIKCKELADLKSRLCFVDEDNNSIIIKVGVKMDFDNLIAILKEKDYKYLKGTKKSKSSSSSTTNSLVSNTFVLNTTNSNIIDSPLISIPTTAINLMSVNDYIQVIANSIEKYSINTFQNIILKHDDAYMIHLNQSGTCIDGYIKCHCKSAIKLPFRLNTKSFQLSHYFKHLKHSLCSMMKKKRQELKKNSNLSHNINQNNILPSLDDEINFDEDSMDNLNENSQITTNKPISTYSDSSKEKRPTSSLLDSDILEIQRIKNVRILLQIPDVFSFFQKNNKDILKLKEQACFIDDDPSCVVRPGIRSNIEQFIELLKNHYKPITEPNHAQGENSCMCGFLNINNGNTEHQSKSFVHIFCEDSTSVVSSVSCDSKTNCFICFAPKLVNGLPLINQFQTNSFNELQEWSQELEKSKSINANLIEPLLNKSSSLIHSRSYIIASYGSDNKYSVKSDVFPDDRENFSSCVKITSNDVLNLLKDMNAKGTYIYRYLLKLVIITYIEADTDIFVRLCYGWILAFSYRMWWCSIQLEETYSQQEKDNHFITRAAWLSVEINIHCLTSLIILVLQGVLPSSSLHTHLFSSQPCESTFRSARALSSTFSSITSFSVSQFLNKIEKIAILNHFKSTEGDDVKCPLKFPIHHKNKHKKRISSTTSLSSASTTINDIEKIIIKAYHEAKKIMNSLHLLQILEENDLGDIQKLNSFVFDQLDSKYKVDYCYFNEIDLQDSADDTNNIQNDTEKDVQIEGYYSDDDNPDDYHFITSKETFQGMKILDKIDLTKKNIYFHIMINNKPKYLHKQTAARLLTSSKNCLSSERLTRVQQTNKQK